MKTCPKCLGEGRVKSTAADWMAFIQPLRALKLLAVVATPFVTLAVVVGVARAALWMTGISNSGDNPGLIFAALMGSIGGLVLAAVLFVYWWDSKWNSK